MVSKAADEGARYGNDVCEDGDSSPPYSCPPNPDREVLMEVKTGSGWRRAQGFGGSWCVKQATRKRAAPCSRDVRHGEGTVSAGGARAPPSAGTLKACKSAPRAVGVVPARGEPVRWPEPAGRGAEAAVPTGTDRAAWPLDGLDGALCPGPVAPPVRATETRDKRGSIQGAPALPSDSTKGSFGCN